MIPIEYQVKYLDGDPFINYLDWLLEPNQIVRENQQNTLRDFRYDYNVIYRKAFCYEVKHD